jgi:uncharacterized protein YgbK (DUF1537 family)
LTPAARSLPVASRGLDTPLRSLVYQKTIGPSTDSLPTVAIAADDLTGAADAIAAFAGRGWRAQAALAPAALAAPRPALAQALDCGSRSVSLRGLGEPCVAEIAGHLARADIAFLKVDSLLRGHAAADIAELARRGPWRRIVVAPAFPACGRTFVGGRAYADGVPAPHAPLAVEGADVVDCETDADLERVVAGAATTPPTLWVGSAGLASALARELAGTDATPADAPPRRRGPTVCVVGSMTAPAQRQALALAAAGARHVTDADGTLPQAVAGEAVVVVSIAGPPVSGEGDERRVRGVAELLAPLRERFGALVLVGGQTAVELLRALGVEALDVHGELEPGVVLSAGPSGLPVVTKSGSFGDDGTLVRVVARLGAP